MPDRPYDRGSPSEPEPDTDPLDPASGAEEGVRLGGIVPDLIRKAVVTGLGAVFMTEEGLRHLAGQLKLPKELMGSVMAQADRTKAEVTRVIGEELRRFLNSEVLRKELLQALSGMTVEIKAEVRLRPDPDAKGAVLPEVQLVDSKLGKGKKGKKGHEG
jgi:hypothetical protein